MPWVLRIEHHTGFRYRGSAGDSYNEARMTPLSGDGQSIVDASVTVEPPAATYSYIDYWGTVVHAFDLHDPHAELQVRAVSIVVTGAEQRLGAEGSLPWHELRSPEIQSEFAELLAPTIYAPIEGEIAEVGSEIGRTVEPGDALEAVDDWLTGRLVYERGVTAVSSSALEALQAGRGVCQDYAHAGVAVLRSMGVPARYVSGYFLPEGGIEIGVPVVAETHAWIEAFTGHWAASDPTNAVPVGERHVVVAKGRDYGDVPPLKGVYSGDPAEDLRVTVALTRIG